MSAITRVLRPDRHPIEGVITTGDVLTHAGLIWREFGARCLLRCAMAIFRTKPTTFLELAIHLKRGLRGG
jgi:hypothetical protein